MKAGVTCDASGARKKLARAASFSTCEMVKMLSYAGEKLLIIARGEHTYTDRTGNLTSSMGYVVANNGRIVTRSSFGSEATGANAGSAFAEQLVQRYPAGVVLIVVAGMNYASYVENGHTARNGSFVRGRIVLAGAKANAPIIINSIIRSIEGQLKSRRQGQ